MEYNTRSRKLNAILASSSGVLQQLVQILGNFAYRTVFLSILTKEYLGINGLFFNVLQLFSLTELGIGSAILYSMYRPFADRDTAKIASLVEFYKKVYRIIGLVILVLGLCLYPFMGSLIKASEVPSDVRPGVVYLLFLMECVVGYFFSYKQSLVTADQKHYLVTGFTCLMMTLGYVVRSVVLIITRDFESVLFYGILLDVTLNWLFSLWITKKYPDVFRIKSPVLPDTEKLTIYRNTVGLMCQKIGTIVVSSTDSIILTRYVSLVATGIYSNYSTIVLAITNVPNRIFTGILPVITNYTITTSKDHTHRLFRRLLFANLWMASFTTVCLYILLNPFITLWLDESFLFGPSVVALICMQHYLQVSRLTAYSFVQSCGLFRRDKIRPLIESVINLTLSILLVQYMGIAGVFVGTCVSGLATYFWREPYLVFKNFFGEGLGKYWAIQAGWFLLTVLMCWGGSWIAGLLPSTLMGFLAQMALAGIGSNLIIIALFFRTDEFRYFTDFLLRKLK